MDAISKPGFPEGRVINGVEAQPGEAPYILSLQSGTSHFCGASLIHPNYAVTAAHCLGGSMTAVAGLHSRSDLSNVQRRTVTKQIGHKGYGGGVGPNDIALLYFAVPFDVNVKTRAGPSPVGVIDLGSNTYEVAGKGQLFGWGRDNSGGLPNNLQKLNADIIGPAQCQKELNNTPSFSVESNLCSYSANKADGACNGDSGGPLINDQGELVGVVSWGYTPCATTTKPSVYTNVRNFKTWIADNMVHHFADYPF